MCIWMLKPLSIVSSKVFSGPCMPFLYLHLYLTIIIDKTPASAQLYNCVVNHVNVFITVRSIYSSYISFSCCVTQYLLLFLLCQTTHTNLFLLYQTTHTIHVCCYKRNLYTCMHCLTKILVVYGAPLRSKMHDRIIDGWQVNHRSLPIGLSITPIGSSIISNRFVDL